MCEHLKRSVFVRLYLFLVLKADFVACLPLCRLALLPPLDMFPATVPLAGY